MKYFKKIRENYLTYTDMGMDSYLEKIYKNLTFHAESQRTKYLVADIDLLNYVIKNDIFAFTDFSYITFHPEK